MKIRIWFRVAAYAIGYFRLLVKAGIIWGCYPDRSLGEMEQIEDFKTQIAASPLKYELQRLQAVKAQIIKDYDTSLKN